MTRRLLSGCWRCTKRLLLTLKCFLPVIVAICCQHMIWWRDDRILCYYWPTCISHLCDHSGQQQQQQQQPVTERAHQRTWASDDNDDDEMWSIDDTSLAKFHGKMSSTNSKRTDWNKHCLPQASVQPNTPCCKQQSSKCSRMSMNHTLAPCQSFLRATAQVNGKVGNSTPAPPQNLWTDRHQNLHGWLRRGPLSVCKIS